jgi:MYXO-CTERM domain-containing protein
VLAATLALATGSASAHAVLTAPLPRDDSDSHKDPNGPCGVGRLESQPVTPLKPGSELTVTWNETVNHPGCFVVDFAAAGDMGWQTLATLPHDATGATPRPYSTMVTLPSAPCSACTLRVRQIMLGEELAPGAVCPPANLGSGLTYYSCANLVLGSDGTAMGGGGTTTGGGTNAAASDGSCGCAIAGGAGERPLELALAVLGLAFAVWRRRLRSASTTESPSCLRGPSH